MKSIKDKIVNYLKNLSLENVLSDLLKAEQEKEDKKEEVKEEEKVVEDTVSTTVKEDFLKEFDKLNSDLKGKTEDTVLDKIEYTPLTSDEIKKVAESGVDKKYNLKIDSLEDALNKAIENLNKDSNKLAEDSELRKAKINSLYQDAEKNVEDNALKRGIARSSIVAEQIKDLGVEKIKDLLSVDEMLASNLRDNAQKINFLQDEYKKAVKNLNVEKVLEIDENIKKLEKEQEDKIEEVLKYNNSIKKQQYDINKSIKAPSEEEQKTIKNKMFEIAFNYYMSIPKDQALKEFLEDKEIRNSLGDYAGVIENYLKARE